jgi:hypothetical protein
MKRMLWRAVVKALRFWSRLDPDFREPYARVREPIPKGPSNRSAAIALKEPDD